MSPPEIEQPPSLLLAASSHRSGSTLLQRYITAMSDIFVWGENGELIPSLRRTWAEWPQTRRNERDYRESMADSSFMQRAYTPNLSPPREAVLAAFRGAVLSIYRDMPGDFHSWGWKAVQYGVEEIDFVRTLFPDIQVILLVRNPWEVARSVRRKGWIDKRGYFEDMSQVATLWANRTAGFQAISEAKEEKVYLVRYSEMQERTSEINRFLGVPDDPVRQEAVFKKKLGKAPLVSRFELTNEDRATVSQIAGELAATMGFDEP